MSCGPSSAARPLWPVNSRTGINWAPASIPARIAEPASPTSIGPRTEPFRRRHRIRPSRPTIPQQTRITPGTRGIQGRGGGWRAESGRGPRPATAAAAPEIVGDGSTPSGPVIRSQIGFRAVTSHDQDDFGASLGRKSGSQAASTSVTATQATTPATSATPSPQRHGPGSARPDRPRDHERPMAYPPAHRPVRYATCGSPPSTCIARTTASSISPDRRPSLSQRSTARKPRGIQAAPTRKMILQYWNRMGMPKAKLNALMVDPVQPTSHDRIKASIPANASRVCATT